MKSVLLFSRAMLSRLGFGKIALAISVGVHAGIAMVATQRAREGSPNVTLASAEIAAPELLAAEPEAMPAPDAEVAQQAPAAVREAAPRAAAHVFPAAAPASVAASEPAAAPSVVATEPSTAHFTMLVAATTALASGTTANARAMPSAAGGFSEAPLAESVVDTRAALRSGAPPSYTAQALEAGIESTVPLELVVDEQGAVASARGLAHVGYGLDEAALRAVRRYRFTPAIHAGRAVAVRMRWVVRFQLQ